MNPLSPNLVSSKQIDEDLAYERSKKRAMAEYIAMIFARTAEVFLRHNFGERYFNVVGSAGSGGLVFAAIVAAWIISSKVGRVPALAGQTDDINSPMLTAFLIAFAVMVAVHAIAAKQRRDKGALLHSRYSGTPLLGSVLPFLKERQIKRAVEPALVILAATVVAPLSLALSGWLAMAGISLAIRAEMQAQQDREKLLDIIDRQLEAELMEEAVRELKEGSRNKGVEILTSFKPYEQKEILKVEEMKKNLDPVLQALMEDDQEPAGEERR